MWHVPLFLSSNEAGYIENSSRRPLWQLLYSAGVDVVLNAQQHHYERFAPQTPDGVLDLQYGIGQFNVGTGGASSALPTVAIHPNSQVRSAAFGILQMTLTATGYTWQFVPIPGETLTDAGSGACHGPPGGPNQPPTAVPGGPYTSEAAVTFDGSGSADADGNVPLTYAWDFGDGTTGTGVTAGHTYTADATYTVTLTVTDALGATGSATTTATIANAPPAVNAGPDATINLGNAFALSAGFTDPGGAAGQYTATVTVTDADGGVGADGVGVTVVDPTVMAVLVGAGDIAQCSGSGDEETAALLDGIPGTVITLGDNVYDDGTAQEFANCYDPSWGRHKARTKPSAGNHDYNTPNATGYYGYFGAAAGDPTKGYYSYDAGTWHVIVLNTGPDNTAFMAAGSSQEQWLRADLAANPHQCTVAYWHHPRFTSVPAPWTARTSSTGGVSCSSSSRTAQHSRHSRCRRPRPSCRWLPCRRSRSTTRQRPRSTTRCRSPAWARARSCSVSTSPPRRSRSRPIRRSITSPANVFPRSTCRAARSRCCPTNSCRPTR
jgi:PKD repeat protein